MSKEKKPGEESHQEKAHTGHSSTEKNQLVNKVASATDLQTEIEQELEQDLADNPNRKSNLDWHRLFPKKAQLRSRLKDASKGLNSKAPRPIGDYVEAFDKAFDEVQAAQKVHANSQLGQRRYATQTLALAKDVYEVVTSFREDVLDRLRHQPKAESIRTACGVGTVLKPDAPQEILTLATQQLTVTQDSASAQLMSDSGLYPVVQKEKLEELVPKLEEAIKQGIGTTVTRGDASRMVERALIKLEITLSRAVVFVKAYGTKTASDALIKAIPKRKAHHTAKTEGEGGTTEENPAESKGKRGRRKKKGSNSEDKSADSQDKSADTKTESQPPKKD
jgi:hypothetical protein